MKDSKSLWIVAIAWFSCLFAPHSVFSQTERLGVVQYTAPKGWLKTQKENVVTFSEINQASGRFCVITLYGATPSIGTPQNDFAKEWNDLVVKPWSGEAKSKNGNGKGRRMDRDRGWKRH